MRFLVSSAGLNSFVPLLQLTTPAFPPFLSAPGNASAFIIVCKPFSHLHVFINLVIRVEDLSFHLRLSCGFEGFYSCTATPAGWDCGMFCFKSILFCAKLNLSHILRYSSFNYPFMTLSNSPVCFIVLRVFFCSVMQPDASQECELISEQMWIFPRQATSFQVILQHMTLNHVVIL